MAVHGPALESRSGELQATCCIFELSVVLMMIYAHFGNKGSCCCSHVVTEGTYFLDQYHLYTATVGICLHLSDQCLPTVIPLNPQVPPMLLDPLQVHLLGHQITNSHSLPPYHSKLTSVFTSLLYDLLIGFLSAIVTGHYFLWQYSVTLLLQLNKKKYSLVTSTSPIIDNYPSYLTSLMLLSPKGGRVWPFSFVHTLMSVFQKSRYNFIFSY